MSVPDPEQPTDRREFPVSFPLPPALRRASRIPLVSGRMDRTRIDRINYSLLTIIVQVERTVSRDDREISALSES